MGDKYYQFKLKAAESCLTLYKKTQLYLNSLTLT